MSQNVYTAQDNRPLPIGSLADDGFRDVVTALNSDPAAAQQDTMTVGGGYAAGTLYEWTMGGIAYSYTSTVADVNQIGVTNSIRDQLNSEPLFSGLYVASTAGGAVVTLDARTAGNGGWALLGVTLIVIANVDVDASAAAVPFGRLVISDGVSADGKNRLAKLATAANMVARAVTLTPVGEPLATYFADVEVDGVTYHAAYTDIDKALLDVGAADAQIRFTSRLDGVDGENLIVSIVAVIGNNNPLTVTVDGDVIVVQPSTDDAGAINCTANEVIQAIQEGTPRLTVGVIATDNAATFINISGVPVEIVITAAAGAGWATVDGADGIVVLTYDAAAGPATTAAQMLIDLAADAPASEYLLGQLPTGTTGLANVAVLAAVPLSPLPSMVMANAAVSVAATGTGLDDIVAVVAANLALAAPAAADINGGLADVLNGMLPAATVIAVGAATLTLTSELAGKDFDFSYGADVTSGAGPLLWTLTSDNHILASDVDDEAMGVSVRLSTIEQSVATDDDEPGYPALSAMNIIRDGRIRVRTEALITLDNDVYVRLADTAVTGEPLGSFRGTAADDCVLLDRKHFSWHLPLSASQAVLQLR